MEKGRAGRRRREAPGHLLQVILTRLTTVRLSGRDLCIVCADWLLVTNRGEWSTNFIPVDI